MVAQVRLGPASYQKPQRPRGGRRKKRGLLKLRFPHPLTLLVGFIVLAAVMSYVLPAGQFDRRDDPATGRRVVVAGTYENPLWEMDSVSRARLCRTISAGACRSRDSDSHPTLVVNLGVHRTAIAMVARWRLSVGRPAIYFFLISITQISASWLPSVK